MDLTKLSDAQLSELISLTNVSPTQHNATVILPQLQFKLLQFALQAEIVRRNEPRTK